MSHLAIEALRVGYGGVTALDGLDLEIGRGELFVLLGGSGSGKTTLLRAIAGFVRPQSGRILLGGRDITALPPHRRPVNTTFQSYALFPHMSVADNVGFGLRRQGRPRAEVAARTAELLAMVGMAEHAGRRPEQLSGGQRQRVALARALAPGPELLLLDEPLSALDRGLRERTRDELQAVQRRTGTTFVLVTHDQDEALAVATRIGLLHQGRLAQLGTPRALYEQPASRYVAEFMGVANLFPARGMAGGLEVEGVGPVPSPNMGLDATWLGIRSERIRLGQGGAGHVDVAGRVERATYRGDVTELAVRLERGALLHAAVPRAEAQSLPGSGEGVALSWPVGACLVLPA